MLGLRQKLMLGFGGLVAILLVVSALSIFALTRYSRTLEKFLSENYRSVVYGQEMKDAINQLDNAADARVAGDLARAEQLTRDGIERFERNLYDEQQNVTLPGERETVQSLQTAWREYLADHQRLRDPSLSEAAGRDLERQTLRPHGDRVQELAQQIVRMNLNNMVSVDGQVKRTAVAARNGLYLMMTMGLLLAVLFVAILSRRILQPLMAVTQSARDIEQGNLDLVVPVRSKDELGQLAEAFNSMAARLREFRRTDRAKLVRTQRTTQLAVNSLPDAIAIVNPDGTVELANQTAQKMFTLRPEQPLSSARIDGLVDLVSRATRDGRPTQPKGYDGAIQVFDEGQERFFLPQAVPIMDTDRQLLGVTLVLADVTNLRRLDEMKSGMLSVVSHELKTPLTSIRMAVHLLLEERVGTLTPKQTELLIAARDDSDRLNQIIENLLDMGRIESGRVMMDLKPLRPEQLVNHATEPLEAAYHDRGVELIVELSDDLPEVSADETRINHVFSNLLTNALKFTPPGGSVRVTAEQEPDVVRFSVADTGGGIPQQYLGRVFDRFFRVPGQGSSSGAGLGLAIAREIVEAHGGQIAVESTEGSGSKFSFTLRRADRADRAGAADAAGAPSTASNNGRRQVIS
jgi:signal transduction histidine kinase/HAMP domain-containing protein